MASSRQSGSGGPRSGAVTGEVRPYRPKSRASKAGSSAQQKAASLRASSNVRFLVVALGASAGGLEAYTDFFKALPAGLGMAFVLVQHLDPTHHSLLAEIISKATKMPVEEVKSGVKIRPDRVYVIPPGALMALTDGLFGLTPRSKVAGQLLAINFFMHSLAEERGSRAIGIVFSGTGFDGTLGLGDMKMQGRLTFVQTPATAKFDGVPRSETPSFAWNTPLHCRRRGLACPRVKMFDRLGEYGEKWRSLCHIQCACIGKLNFSHRSAIRNPIGKLVFLYSTSILTKHRG